MKNPIRFAAGLGLAVTLATPVLADISFSTSGWRCTYGPPRTCTYYGPGGAQYPDQQQQTRRPRTDPSVGTIGGPSGRSVHNSTAEAHFRRMREENRGNN